MVVQKALDLEPRFRADTAGMVLCPKTKTPGKKVKTVTVESLAREEARSTAQGREWSFCPEPDCDVVYFAADGATLLKGDVTVRVGAKETESPRPVCYCFGHTKESIRDEVLRAGESTVVESVTAKVKAGECSCETMNPKGSCCLGDLRKAVKEATS